MKTSAMQDFVIEKLRTLYDAEKQLTKALPRMARAASDEELAEGFRQHAHETQEQMARIEQILQTMGVKARGITCAPMQALIEDGRNIIAADMEDSLRDVGLASSARAVEHFEMACYDALLGVVQSSRQTDIAQLLQQTLREEAETDKKLTTISRRLLKEAKATRPAVEEEKGAGKRSRSKSRSASASASGGNLSHYATDHDAIRRWAEARGGKPACVEGTGGEGDIGMLRIEFAGKPNAKDSKLHEISWDDFFEKFDERNLALVYQDKTGRGQKSNFNKIVSRETGRVRTAGGR